MDGTVRISWRWFKRVVEELDDESAVAELREFVLFLEESNDDTDVD